MCLLCAAFSLSKLGTLLTHAIKNGIKDYLALIIRGAKKRTTKVKVEKTCMRRMLEFEGLSLEQLSKIEENMLIIIYQYKEKVNLAASHGQMLEDE